MIIFLYGPDDYRRIARKHFLVTEFQKKYSSGGLAAFSGDTPDVFDSLAEFIRSQSIFETAKLAILEDFSECDPAKLAKTLLPALNLKGTTVLIEGSAKPVKALAFLLKEPVRVEPFEILENVEWLAFINTEAKKMGVKIAPPALTFLATVYQGNSWGLVMELQKLSAAVPNEVVDKDLLEKLDLEIAPNYWALLNGLKSPEGRVRLSALERLLALNDPPPKIFNILAAQAGEKIPRMAEYDFAVKSGRFDYEEALLDFVLASG